MKFSFLVCLSFSLLLTCCSDTLNNNAISFYNENLEAIIAVNEVVTSFDSIKTCSFSQISETKFTITIDSNNIECISSQSFNEFFLKKESISDAIHVFQFHNLYDGISIGNDGVVYYSMKNISSWKLVFSKVDLEKQFEPNTGLGNIVIEKVDENWYLFHSSSR